jgi:RecB family exonuclease
MNPALLKDKEESAVESQIPHLSHSRINRYLHCPEQYRLYYIENLRPKVPAASLVFGQIVHQALASLFRDGTDPVKSFEDAWNEVQQIGLDYSQRESWEKLQASGRALLEMFVRHEQPRLERIEAPEKRFELTITTLGLPFIGIIDLIANLDGKKTVVDFKTAGSGYQDHEVILADQLTAYQLAEPSAEQTSFCVLVKTKEPQIEWHLGRRSGEQLTEYISKADYVAHEITAGRFYKRTGKWCSWCDYLPVCMGDRKTVEETLVQIQ